MHLPLELIPQCELDEPRIDRRRRDHTEQRVVGLNRGRANVAVWGQRKLRVIKQVEEFGAELDVLILANSRHLGYRKIRICLARTTNDAYAGVAKIGCNPVITDDRRSTKRRGVNVSRDARIANAAQPVFDVTLGENLVVGHTRTQLRPADAELDTCAATHTVSRAGPVVEYRQRAASREECESGNGPALGQSSQCSARTEWQFVLVAHDEPVWDAVRCRPVLLPHVRRIVQISTDIADVRQILAPCVGGLEAQPTSEPFADGGLQAVVVGRNPKYGTRALAFATVLVVKPLIGLEALASRAVLTT